MADICLPPIHWQQVQIAQECRQWPKALFVPTLPQHTVHRKGLAVQDGVAGLVKRLLVRVEEVACDGRSVLPVLGGHVVVRAGARRSRLRIEVGGGHIEHLLDSRPRAQRTHAQEPQTHGRGQDIHTGTRAHEYKFTHTQVKSVETMAV